MRIARLVQDAASSFVPYLGLLDGLWQLWDRPWQQCLHDKPARTVMVKPAGDWSVQLSIGDPIHSSGR